MELIGLVLAAGLSSRFGGKVKALTPVGPLDESLLEVAVQQAKNCGVTKLVIVVSPATQSQIEKVTGTSFLDLPVSYAIQTPPSWRSKPLGTVQAVLAARSLLTAPFIVINIDTNYGEEPLRLVCDFLRRCDALYREDKDDESRLQACSPAYQLRNCMPSNNTKVNRAIMSREAGSLLLQSIKEEYNICSDDVGPGRKFSGDELTSLNVFGFFPAHLPAMQASLDEFMAALEAESEANPAPVGTKDKFARELILADAFNTFTVGAKHTAVVLGPVTSSPLDITYPDDAADVKQALIKLQQENKDRETGNNADNTAKRPKPE